MKFSYTFTALDFVNINALLTENSQGYRKTVMIQRCLGFIASAFVLLLNLVMGKALSVFTLIPLFVIGTAWFFAFPKLNRHFMFKQIQKRAMQNENLDFVGEYNVNLQKETLIISHEGKDTRISLRDVERHDYTAKYLFIYVKGGQATILPTEDLPETFVDELEARVNALKKD
ncbi:MAG: YcxB family protein [Bacilli bacterium]